ncbi:MAG: hypothetical protein K1Y02_08740 [Candidatus Hydrogenedentes bacterium]|nr:hypothetical protein [Candidatus Hydrogenedentota bacterium]
MSYVFCALAFALAAAQGQFVTLPAGKTMLGDIGYLRVAYRSYDGPRVDMPVGWQGQDAPSGVTYQPSEQMFGREALMMHSPWRVPLGMTWIEYPIHLPDQTPIVLKFGIAMSRAAFDPGKSDGVTFSAAVVDESGDHELMREHYAVAAWKDVQLDLAPYAGKDVTLRLQVEPGPKKDCGWDYSYFSAPSISVGTDDSPKVALDGLIDSPAMKATEGVSLARATNDASMGVVPSSLLDGKNAVVADGDNFRFMYEGADGRVVYTYTPATGTLDDFSASINDTPAFAPALGGGVFAAIQKDGREQILALRGGAARSIELSAGDRPEVHLTWDYSLEGKTISVQWRFGMRGKALTVSATSSDAIIGTFSLGREGNVAFRRVFQVPYLWGSISYLPEQKAFTCRYLDWTVSNASNCPQGDANYETKTDGTRNTLNESAYIAISQNVAEVLPNIPSKPSPFLELLGPRIMLDIWQHHDGTYAGDAANLRDLKDNGIDHLAIISHVWQCFGYDVKLPDHLPANEQFGGDEGMKEFGKAANECGYVWSLHENYTDLYPDAPSYDESARAVNSDGSPVLGWYNAGTKVQSFGIKCNRSLGFAEKNSPDIHARFGTNAAYLDVHTCVPPWHVLDHDASQPLAAMARAKYVEQTKLFQYMRDTHKGPMFGEGNYQFFWAGLFDGAEAQVNGGEDHAPFLDFDLLKIHPQMVNHGMGYYERWFRRGYDHQWGHDTGTPEQVDKYRAQEIAYGHAGFIGAAQTDNVQWVAKEHHMMYPIQRLANTAKPKSILYEVDGRMVPIGVALVADRRLRQHIEYDSGLRVWVNWGEEPWTVEGRVLPQWGVLALGDGTQVETVLKEGVFADHVACPEYVYVDARTSFNMPYVNREKKIEPRLKTFEWLGGNKVRLSYEWVVNDSLDTDYLCFVHFTTPLISTADSIAFQQDHALPKPSSQWKAGDTIDDGPYEITIPDAPITEYNVTIGLHQEGRRVPLKGVSTSGNRILIGKLLVQRDGNTVTGVRLGDTTADTAAANKEKADFTAHLNPEGTWVDFGNVATDGSVKVEKRANELMVLPYPRDKSFTVELDVASLLGEKSLSPSVLRVTALARGSQEVIGDVPFDVRDSRIVFTVGLRNAGRYRVTSAN